MSIFSGTFIIFAAVLVVVYYALPKRFQWGVLLIASLLFYLTCGWQGIFFILVTIISQYYLALALERKNGEMTQRLETEGLDGKQKKQIKKEFASHKKRYVLFSVLINLGILCFFKYTNVAIESAMPLLKRFGIQVSPLNLLTPLGLSYYTFRSIGYVIDVYRGRISAQKNIFKLALFVGYFPALLQGPIDRYEDIQEQLFSEHAFDYDRLMFGMQRMLWGYIKKLVIADRAAVIVREVIGSYADKGYVGFIVFFGGALYAFQLYADFSGGIDITNGLSEIFGIQLTENFRQPFFGRSVAEYWQRWHITLGAWMRTYVFYPISLSQPFNKLGKKCRKTFGDRFGKLIAPSLASFITFFLIGMWDGVGWKYVVWGVYQALFVATGTLFEDFYAKGREVFKVNDESKVWQLFQIVRTFFVITLSRYVSIAKDLPDVGGLFRATFTHFNPWVFFDGSFYTLGLDRKNFTFLIFSITVMMVIDYIKEKGIRIRESVARQNIVLRWVIYYAAIFALIIFGMYGPGYDAASFIYQNF